MNAREGAPSRTTLPKLIAFREWTARAMFAAIRRASFFVSSFLALALPRNERKLAVVRRDRPRQGKQVVLRQSMVAGSNEADAFVRN